MIMHNQKMYSVCCVHVSNIIKTWWWHGLVVTHRSRPMQLLYIGPS